MGTKDGTVNGWRLRAVKYWYGSIARDDAIGPTATTAQDTVSSSWQALNKEPGGLNASASCPTSSGTTSSNNKHTVVFKITTPAAETGAHITKISISFKYFVHNGTYSSNPLYGSLRTTAASTASDTLSTYRTNVAGGSAEESITPSSKGSSTNPLSGTLTFTGSFDWNTSYYLFLYTKTTSMIYGMYGITNNQQGATCKTTWAYDTYTVSYDANEGTGAPNSQTKTYGTDLTLSSTIPTRTNYNFVGWGTTASDDTKDYDPGGKYTTNANITLYAIWVMKGIVHIYDGSTWKQAIPYVYDGSAWKQVIPYIYNGSTWKRGE